MPQSDSIDPQLGGRFSRAAILLFFVGVLWAGVGFYGVQAAAAYTLPVAVGLAWALWRSVRLSRGRRGVLRADGVILFGDGTQGRGLDPAPPAAELGGVAAWPANRHKAGGYRDDADAARFATQNVAVEHTKIRRGLNLMARIAALVFVLITLVAASKYVGET